MLMGMTASDRSATTLALFLAGASATHALKPGFYDPMVPAALPGRARLWTYASGVAELTVAATIAVPKTRRLGALAAAGLFIGVFPANVKMAVDAFTEDRSTGQKAGGLIRLPLQLPLIRWALKVSTAA
jgi:uncharacterized membrane protein